MLAFSLTLSFDRYSSRHRKKLSLAGESPPRLPGHYFMSFFFAEKRLMYAVLGQLLHLMTGFLRREQGDG